MSNHITDHPVTDDDIRYFQQKLDRAIGTPSEDRERKRLAMIEDAVIIYHEHRPQENVKT